MKKWLLMGCLLLASGCSNTAFALKGAERTENAVEEQIDFRIGLAVGSAFTLNANTYEAISWEGVVQYVNRYPRLQVQRGVPQKDEDPEFQKNVDQLLEMECDVIIGLGDMYSEIFQTAAKENPETVFMLFQGGGLQPESENLVSIEFEDQQSSFLGGVAAALNTESGKVGFLGGDSNDSVVRQMLGFEAGVLYANAQFGTIAAFQKPQFAGTFEDMTKGRSLAKKMYGEGLDVIFVCAGTTGMGAIEQAKVLSEQEREVWLIGVDKDLYDEGKGADEKSVILTSVIKHMDVVLYEILEDYARDRFPSGSYLLRNLADGSQGLPKENKNFNEKTSVLVGKVQEEIVSGELVLPYELEALDSYVKSLGGIGRVEEDSHE